MNDSRFEPLTPLTGIVFVLLLVVGVALTGTVDYFPTKDRALEIFSANPAQVQRGAIIGGFYGSVFLLWFAGSVFSALRRRQDQNERLAIIAFGGGTLTAISAALAFAVIWVAAARAGRSAALNADTALIMYDLSSTIMASLVSSGLAILIGATGIGSLRTSLFPTWFGWISVVVALGLLSPIHYIFEGVAVVWIVVMSLLLLLQGRQLNQA